MLMPCDKIWAKFTFHITRSIVFNCTKLKYKDSTDLKKFIHKLLAATVNILDLGVVMYCHATGKKFNGILTYKLQLN